jgi:hypothetical protein
LFYFVFKTIVCIFLTLYLLWWLVRGLHRYACIFILLWLKYSYFYFTANSFIFSCIANAVLKIICLFFLACQSLNLPFDFNLYNLAFSQVLKEVRMHSSCRSFSEANVKQNSFAHSNTLEANIRHTIKKKIPASPFKNYQGLTANVHLQVTSLSSNLDGIFFLTYSSDSNNRSKGIKIFQSHCCHLRLQIDFSVAFYFLPEHIGSPWPIIVNHSLNPVLPSRPPFHCANRG